LTKLFEAELGPELTPMQRLRLEQAAQLMATGEEARGRWPGKPSYLLQLQRLFACAGIGSGGGTDCGA
jgi:hypothetical protein